MSKKLNKRQRRARIRREKIRQLRIRGLTISEIAKILDISIKTVRRHLTALKNDLKESSKEHVEVYVKLCETAQSRNEALRDIWRIYHNSKETKEKLEALKVIMHYETELLKFYEKTNLLVSKNGNCKKKEKGESA